MDPRLMRLGNRVTILRDGAEAYPRMLAAIGRASRSILVEMYMIADDATGRRFADALIARARNGVTIRLIYDALGCVDTPDEFFDRLREAGVRVHAFHPFRALRRRRDHRKLIVVDGRTAFVGGINITRDYDAPSRGGLGWRDMAVGLEGPVVPDLVEIFSRSWKRYTHETLERPDAAPVEGGIAVAALGSERWRSRRSIAHAYLDAIRAAKERIWISNAYFVPARRFVRALRGAARRGVDVRVLVPSHTDIRPVYHATRALFAPLLRRGVRIFEWQGPMLHAKTAVIDGRWCTVGSYNLDHLSLFHNFELTVIVEDGGIGARMEKIFEEDLKGSTEITRAEWKRRRWSRRLVEQFFYFFRALL